MAEPTNLIVFLGENHGRHVTGAYGHPMIQSPNIDWIANKGARFDNAYCSSPICCPARASVATGRYPHQTGYWENAIPYDGRVPSWMHRLRDVGHEVVAIGKLHFRSTDDDNGFTEEILPMHIVDGVGQVVGLLRGTGEERVRPGVWEMYAEELGVGETSYHDYDRRITAAAIDWLKGHMAKPDIPWVLCVHYGSAHPPFKAPQRLLDLYPLDRVPLPVCWRPDERPDHPAVTHLRRILGTHETIDEHTLRRIVAGYYALITHLDEQVGQVLSAAEDVGLLADARIFYSADHGDSCGNHYIFGKFNMYERSVGGPFMMCGPDIPAGRVVNQIASHIDLFPTLLEAMGVEPEDADGDLSGISLWPAMQGSEKERTGFIEYHALGSKNASFVIRQESDKLIYHVDMPSQLFDLANDPEETRDLAQDERGKDMAAKLESTLRDMLDPEETDRRGKRDQRHLAQKHGGKEAIIARGCFPRTPVPNAKFEYLPFAEPKSSDETKEH